VVEALDLKEGDEIEVSFDAMRNVLASNQVTAGQTYSFSYGYNLAGALLSETYPSGRVVTTGYDAASRATSVSGQAGPTTTNYITQAAYWPHGGSII
jgi:YD repeat-containing protein